MKLTSVLAILAFAFAAHANEPKAATAAPAKKAEVAAAVSGDQTAVSADHTAAKKGKKKKNK